MKLSFLIFSILLLNPLFAIKDPVVATVNGMKITKSIFEKTYNQNLLFVSDKIVTRKKVINDLINRELGIQRAKKAKLQNNSEVKYKMEDILYHAQISKDLEPRLKKIVVTDKEVATYYKKNMELRTAHILFRVRAQPSSEEVIAAQKMAFEVYKKVKQKPNKFSELANKFSQSSTAPNGGDMGFQPAVRMAPEYFAAIKGKPKGYITPPVRTQFGYHLIKILAVKNYNSINKSLYKKIVYDKKRDAILSSYFKDLKKNAKVTINREYLKPNPYPSSSKE